jgi:hypothetical protein
MKKFIASLLVFSILALSANLYAKEKRGANIEIYKTRPKMEGTPFEMSDIKGELIAVKENSLLLLDLKSGTDVAVDINEIYSIKIVKKSKALPVAVFGLLIGGVGGAVIGSTGKRKLLEQVEETPLEPYFRELTKNPPILLWGVIGGFLGLLIGGLIGASTGTDETIQITGKSDSEIQEILEELRKKARIRNSQ